MQHCSLEVKTCIASKAFSGFLLHERVIQSLYMKLERTLPFESSMPGAKHHYGINTNLLKEIVDFWRTEYDWKERMELLLHYQQFKVRVQGLMIHFQIARPPRREGSNLRIRVPLLMLHGWPGSVWEFYEIMNEMMSPARGHQICF
ncbi:hypothetical protein NQ318_017908 [Aromia moschata]|uniref:Epoxide hydrolase N-terminal domain-containing protein n=1 Tax=Aromia moschata TaxID=1265417 RepID=A0AAV8YDD6_9CUCU|nr:hypothetical protein NQ318_017908 [Aromia moschata]